MDQNLFFDWLRQIMTNKNASGLLNDEILKQLFRNKIVNIDKSILKSLRVNSLECIVRMFVLVNESDGKVIDLEQSKSNDDDWKNWPNNQWSGYSYSYDNTGDSDSSKQKFTEFRLTVPPSELEGLPVLWQLLDSYETTNLHLFTRL